VKFDAFLKFFHLYIIRNKRVIATISMGGVGDDEHMLLKLKIMKTIILNKAK
jgi:hypothetical protein